MGLQASTIARASIPTMFRANPSSAREGFGMSDIRSHFEDLFGALPQRPDRRAYDRSSSALLTYGEVGHGNGRIRLDLSEGGLANPGGRLLTSDYFPSVR